MQIHQENPHSEIGSEKSPQESAFIRNRTICSKGIIEVSRSSDCSGLDNVLHTRAMKQVLTDIYGKGSKYHQCLKFVHQSTGGVQILNRDGRYKYSGRWRCRHRGCPVCQIVRERKNASKIEGVLNHEGTKDDLTLFVTLTQKRSNESLSDALAVQAKMRSALNRSLHNKKGWGFKGAITSVEYTYRLYDGAVHPHSHLALFFEKEALLERFAGFSLDGIVAKMKEYIVGRWLALGSRYGVTVHQKGQDVQLIEGVERKRVGAYLQKFASELAMGFNKDSRAAGVYTYAQLLNFYHQDPREDVKRAIRTLNSEIKYKRTFQVSTRLKQYLDEDEYEVSEEDIHQDVPVAVYGRLAQYENENVIVDILNGRYNHRRETEDILSVFYLLCKVFSSGNATLKDKMILREFAKGLDVVNEDKLKPDI